MKTEQLIKELLNKAKNFNLVKAQNSTNHWFNHLEIQNRLTEFLDNRYILSDPDWIASDSILDMGSGHGFYLENLASKYPKKKFVGIDIDDKAIKFALKNRSVNTSYKCMSLYENLLPGGFDVCIAKLLVQHLKDISGFISSIQKVLVPGGVAYIIEGHDQFKRFHPELPSVKNAYKKLQNKYQSIGANREAAYKIAQIASNQGLLIEREEIVCGQSGIDFPHETLYQMQLTNCKTMNDIYGLNLDQLQIEKELNNWINTTNKYGGIGLHLLKIKKPIIS